MTQDELNELVEAVRTEAVNTGAQHGVCLAIAVLEHDATQPVPSTHAQLVTKLKHIAKAFTE